MYKRILVPVDGSHTSTLGLREAVRLARDQKARIRLMHVLDIFPLVQGYDSGAVSGEMWDILEDSGKKALKNAAALAAKHRINAQSVMLKNLGGRVADSIVDEARNWKADIIVMGTHGRRGFNHLILGSDAEAVVRSAPVPVLLVRPATTKKRRS
jgi:nucleotide-binding universal stress UspA family protein